MKIISQVPYKDIEINFLEEKDHVGYSFGYQGRNYGTKVLVKPPTGKKNRQTYIEAIALLIINAIELYGELSRPKVTGTSEENIFTAPSTGTTGN